VILLLLLFGWQRDLFQTTADYDVLMHFLGGGFFVITFAGLLWCFPWGRKLIRRTHPVFFRTLLFSGLFCVSIAWEFLEVGLNMTPNWTQSPGDTVFDMVCAMAGAAIALCFIHPAD